MGGAGEGPGLRVRVRAMGAPEAELPPASEWARGAGAADCGTAGGGAREVAPLSCHCSVQAFLWRVSVDEAVPNPP